MQYLLTACFFSALLLFSFRSPLQFVVSGKITDEKGMPMSGASIVIKGKPISTTTKTDGSFQLTINSEKAILIISAVIS